MPSYVVRHHGGWKYKRSIPGDVRDAFGGRKSWTTYFKVRTQREAEASGRVEATKHDHWIKTLRAMPQAERTTIAAHGGIKAFDATTSIVERDRPPPQMLSLTLEPTASENEPLALPEDWDRWKKVEEADGKVRVARRILKKLDRDGSALAQLVDTWIAVNQPRSPEGIKKYRAAMRDFIGVVGDMPPRDLTPAHARAFRDVLEKNPRLRKATSKLKPLEYLHAIMNAARSIGVVEINIFDGVKIAKRKGKFSDEESKKPFAAKHVRAIFNKMKGQSEDFQWTVRLCAYHGAASGEIAQLRVEDITSVAGVPVMRLHDEADGQTIKNVHRVREVPIHPKCRGIIAYAMKVEGPWVFGSFRPWKGRRGEYFQRKASPWLREVVGITDTDFSMHSLRHTFRLHAREMNMPVAISRSIMGHSQGPDHHSDYGGVPSLKLRAKWLKKIDPLK